jgi:multicomponent Na+:H+ antiporter subunit C
VSWIPGWLPYGLAVWLFLVGLYGVATSRNLIHLILCLSVVQSATYVALLAVGFRSGAGAPVYSTVRVGTPGVDPVVQALTLTDVVVGVVVTALLLALAVQAHKRTGTLDPDELRILRD